MPVPSAFGAPSSTDLDMTTPERDSRFRVGVLDWTEGPQALAWCAMHQDYSERFVFDEDPPEETEAGRLVVKHLLYGDRGHYGPLEHPQITFAVGWFPHSVMQQARTHRVGISFDVQSGRYTGERICRAVRGELPLEDVFYLRPLGTYTDRQGRRYVYTDTARLADLDHLQALAWHYAARIERDGFSEEHARDLIPYAIRQHFVVSFNLRSLMHFLDLRAKRDAQWEIRQLCDLMFPYFQNWAPEIATWYREARLHRARLSP